MKIEIDSEFVDSVVRQGLFNTYLNLTEDLDQHKRNIHKLFPEDLQMYEKVIAAIKVVGEWYCINFDKELRHYERLHNEENRI